MDNNKFLENIKTPSPKLETTTCLKIACGHCLWISPEMDKKAEQDRGVPWYCDRCGTRVTTFVRYNKGEWNKVQEWERLKNG